MPDLTIKITLTEPFTRMFRDIRQATGCEDEDIIFAALDDLYNRKKRGEEWPECFCVDLEDEFKCELRKLEVSFSRWCKDRGFDYNLACVTWHKIKRGERPALKNSLTDTAMIVDALEELMGRELV